MLRGLILTLSFLSIAAAREFNPRAVSRLALSKQWLRALYYQPYGKGHKSLVRGDMFFLSEHGARDPEAELLATIRAFKQQTPHKLGPKAVCLMQGRWQILHREFPQEFPPVECPDYQEWLKGMDAGEMYLVYSSAYPNNPASMFGHTFLRFDRRQRSDHAATKELLGYSLAFQARTNAEDNALTYSWKGITGGYLAFLDIKPHYINIGVYNNSESRDLWEYPLELTSEEKQLLLAHVWEVSNLVGFDYYFLDENCSTFLVRMLEVVKLDWDLPSKRDMFVVPQQTLKQIVQKGEANPRQRHSIRKQLMARYFSFDHKQKQVFAEVKAGERAPESIADPAVLDGLIDYWKYQNYKDYQTISEQEKLRMHNTLAQRATVGGASEQLELPLQQQQRPDLGHEFSTMSVNLGERQQRLEARYGFHDFHDPAQGMDQQAYIKFMHLEANLEDERWLLSQVQLVDILSLQDFTLHLPQFSWRGTLSYAKNAEEVQWNLLGGIGMAQSKADSWQSFGLLVAQVQREIELEKSWVRPGLNLGLRRIRSDKNWASAEVLLLDKESARGIWSWNFAHQQWVTTPLIEVSEGQAELRLKLTRYF